MEKQDMAYLLKLKEAVDNIKRLNSNTSSLTAIRRAIICLAYDFDIYGIDDNDLKEIEEIENTLSKDCPPSLAAFFRSEEAIEEVLEESIEKTSIDFNEEEEVLEETEEKEIVETSLEIEELVENSSFYEEDEKKKKKKSSSYIEEESLTNTDDYKKSFSQEINEIPPSSKESKDSAVEGKLEEAYQEDDLKNTSTSFIENKEEIIINPIEEKNNNTFTIVEESVSLDSVKTPIESDISIEEITQDVESPQEALISPIESVSSLEGSMDGDAAKEETVSLKEIEKPTERTYETEELLNSPRILDKDEVYKNNIDEQIKAENTAAVSNKLNDTNTFEVKETSTVDEVLIVKENNNIISSELKTNELPIENSINSIDTFKVNSSAENKATTVSKESVEAPTSFTENIPSLNENASGGQKENVVEAVTEGAFPTTENLNEVQKPQEAPGSFKESISPLESSSLHIKEETANKDEIEAFVPKKEISLSSKENTSIDSSFASNEGKIEQSLIKNNIPSEVKESINSLKEPLETPKGPEEKVSLNNTLHTKERSFDDVKESVEARTSFKENSFFVDESSLRGQEENSKEIKTESVIPKKENFNKTKEFIETPISLKENVSSLSSTVGSVKEESSKESLIESVSKEEKKYKMKESSESPRNSDETGVSNSYSSNKGYMVSEATPTEHKKNEDKSFYNTVKKENFKETQVSYINKTKSSDGQKESNVSTSGKMEDINEKITNNNKKEQNNFYSRNDNTTKVERNYESGSAKKTQEDLKTYNMSYKPDAEHKGTYGKEIKTSATPLSATERKNSALMESVIKNAKMQKAISEERREVFSNPQTQGQGTKNVASSPTENKLIKPRTIQKEKNVNSSEHSLLPKEAVNQSERSNKKADANNGKLFSRESSISADKMSAIKENSKEVGLAFKDIPSFDGKTVTYRTNRVKEAYDALSPYEKKNAVFKISPLDGTLSFTVMRGKKVVTYEEPLIQIKKENPSAAKPHILIKNVINDNTYFKPFEDIYASLKDERIRNVLSKQIERKIYKEGTSVFTRDGIEFNIKGKILPAEKDKGITPIKQSSTVIKTVPYVIKETSDLHKMKTTALGARDNPPQEKTLNKIKLMFGEIFKRKEKDDEKERETEKAIKSLKDSLIKNAVVPINKVGQRGCELVFRTVSDSSTEGYREIKRNLYIPGIILKTGNNRILLNNEINKLKNINSLTEFISRNPSIDFDKVSKMEFEKIRKNVHNKKYSLVKKDSDKKFIPLTLSQKAMVEKARNYAATRGIIMSNIDKLPPSYKEIINDAHTQVFNFASAKGLKYNNDITIRLLRDNKYLAKFNFNGAGVKDLKKLLNSKYLSSTDKIFVKNLIQNKNALRLLDKYKGSKGAVIGSAVSKLKGGLNDDTREGLETSLSYLRTGKKIIEMAEKVMTSKTAKVVEKAGVKVVKTGAKGVRKVGKLSVKGVKYIGNKTGISKPIVKGINSAQTTFRKVSESKPVKVMKKAGSVTKTVASTPYKVAKGGATAVNNAKKKVVNKKSQITQKISNNKLVKIVTSPFKGAAKVLGLTDAIKNAIMKYLFIFAGIWVLVMGAGALAVGIIIPSVMASMAGVMIMEEETTVQAWVEELRQWQAAQDEEVINLVTGNPKGKDVNGNKLSSYGMPEVIAPDGSIHKATDGYKIVYVDNYGNEIAKADNSKDILSFLAVYLQQDFDLGDGYISGMTRELFDKTHPEILVEESEIYFCDYGCETSSYDCNTAQGEHNYMTYGDRTYNYWGCDPYYDYCLFDCYCPGHEAECTADCPTDCVGGHIEFCLFNCECPGHYTSRCSEIHTQRICYGHRDVVVTIKTLFLDDLLDEEYYLQEDKSFIHFLYNGKLTSLKEAFDLEGGWNADNKEWAYNIYNQDWYEFYGVRVSSVGLDLESVMSDDEIVRKMVQASNLSTNRQALYKLGLRSVGVIPYYYNGRTSFKGLDTNSFGSLTSPDGKGNNRIGLDSYGYIDFMYNSIYDISFKSVNELIYNSTQISSNSLEIGDFAVNRNNLYIGIFAGYNEYGDKLWLHLSSTTGNVVIDNSNCWSYYYRPHFLD